MKTSTKKLKLKKKKTSTIHMADKWLIFITHKELPQIHFLKLHLNIEMSKQGGGQERRGEGE